MLATRIRRSTGGLRTPLSVKPANLALWLRADSLSGTPVASWQDKRGGSFPTFTQGTGASQPIWSATAMNGMPGVTFDGVDDKITTAATIAAAGNHTIFVATDPDNTPTVDGFLVDSQTGRLILTHNQGSYLFWDGVARGTVELGAVTPIYVTYVLDSTGGNSAAVYQNGTPIEGGLGYTQRALSGTTAIGGWHGGSGSWFKGVIAELIVYSTVLSLAERIAIEKYLRNRYRL